MAGCPPVKFEGVTRDQFTCLQLLVKEKTGVGIASDQGSESDGDDKMALTWNYDETAALLTLEVTKSAYPCFLVIPRLKSFISTCL